MWVGRRGIERPTGRKKIPICMIIRLGIGFLGLFLNLCSGELLSHHRGGGGGIHLLVSIEDTPGWNGGSFSAGV